MRSVLPAFGDRYRPARPRARLRGRLTRMTVSVSFPGSLTSEPAGPTISTTRRRPTGACTRIRAGRDGQVSSSPGQTSTYPAMTSKWFQPSSRRWAGPDTGRTCSLAAMGGSAGRAQTSARTVPAGITANCPLVNLAHQTRGPSSKNRFRSPQSSPAAGGRVARDGRHDRVFWDVAPLESVRRGCRERGFWSLS